MFLPGMSQLPGLSRGMKEEGEERVPMRSLTRREPHDETQNFKAVDFRVSLWSRIVKLFEMNCDQNYSIVLWISIVFSRKKGIIPMRICFRELVPR